MTLQKKGGVNDRQWKGERDYYCFYGGDEPKGVRLAGKRIESQLVEGICDVCRGLGKS